MVKEYAVICIPLDNGKFKYLQRYPDPLKSTPNKVVLKSVSVTLTKNTKQAENKARKILADKIAKKLQGYSNDSVITFGEVVENYKNVASKRLAISTYYSKSGVADKIARMIGTDTIASNLTTEYFNKFFDNLIYENQLSNATVSSYKSIVNQCYNLAISHGLLKDNPIDKVKINYRSEVQKRRNEIEKKYFEEEELDIIFDDLIKHGRQDLADLLKFQSRTGMRIGEATALQKKNIIKRGSEYYARVTGDLYQIRNYHGKGSSIIKTQGAKNISSNRDVLLSPTAKKIALEHCKNKSANDYIFTNNRSSSGVFKGSKINRTLKSVKQRTGIDKIFTTHTFRHSYVSILAQKGVPLYLIQSQTGHSNSKIISKVYLHVTQKAKQELAKKMKDLNF